jgi:hypothetical protein
MKDRKGNDLNVGDYVVEIGAPFEAGKIVDLSLIHEVATVYYGPSVYREANAEPKTEQEIGEGEIPYDAHDLVKILPPATPNGDWIVANPES